MVLVAVAALPVRLNRLVEVVVNKALPLTVKTPETVRGACNATSFETLKLFNAVRLVGSVPLNALPIARLDAEVVTR